MEPNTPNMSAQDLSAEPEATPIPDGWPVAPEYHVTPDGRTVTATPVTNTGVIFAGDDLAIRHLIVECGPRRCAVVYMGRSLEGNPTWAVRPVAFGRLETLPVSGEFAVAYDRAVAFCSGATLGHSAWDAAALGALIDRWGRLDEDAMHLERSDSHKARAKREQCDTHAAAIERIMGMKLYPALLVRV